MGKRKLHGENFYQCEWTGFPMRQSNCYMPSWQGNKKMSKRGSYCNWESVLAHAHHMYDVEKSIDASELAKIREHLTAIMGPLPDFTLYHYSFLAHFKDDTDKWEKCSDLPLNLTMDSYHAACCVPMEDVRAVKLAASGETTEVILEPLAGLMPLAKSLPDREIMGGDYSLNEHLSMPYYPTYEGSRTQMYPTEETVPSKGKNSKELAVYFWAHNNGLPTNNVASNLMKMQINGDMLLVNKTKENAFKARTRYHDYTLEQYNEQFSKKKKRQAPDMNSISSTEYGKLKEQMCSSLNGYEAQISSSAERPADLARGAAIPPASGKDLKVVAQLMGNVPPRKLARLEARLVGDAAPVE